MTKKVLVHLLMPEDLKRSIEEAASSKGNSFSAEIRARLYSSMEKRQSIERLQEASP
jgi:hypothetical protein